MGCPPAPTQLLLKSIVQKCYVLEGWSQRSYLNLPEIQRGHHFKVTFCRNHFFINDSEMGNTTTEQKGLMSYRFRDVIREKCGFRALVKADACLWEKQQRPEAATAAVTFRCDIRPRGRTLTHTPPRFVSSLQPWFLQRHQGIFLLLLKGQFHSFVVRQCWCNYKRSCFKTGIPMNLPKQAISLLAFFPSNFLLLFLWISFRLV